MKFKLFLNFIGRNNPIFKFLRRRAVITFLSLGIIISYQDQIAMSILGDSYSLNKCESALKDRFEFTNKYLQNPNREEYDFCTIFPTNTYDIKKILEIANYYKIPIISDVNSSQNILSSPHFRIDFSKYNKIIDFNIKSKTITVEPGAKISEILEYLEKHNLTIPRLANYKHTDLVINDIYFNNYFGFNQGKFIDNIVEEITIAIPRNERLLKLKQNDDLTMTGLNLKDLFLRTNSNMGLIIESKLKVKKNKNLRYLCIRSLENKLDETLGIINEIKESKKELGLKDINILYRDKEIDICLKIKDKHIEKSVEILKATHVIFDQINKEDYYKSLVLSNSHSAGTHTLRKLKISMNKNSIPEFLKKANTIAEESNIEMEFRCSYLNHELEMIIFTKDDLVSVENSYKYINKIHSLVLKSSGNIFSKDLNEINFFSK
jgi:hypothetical protein